MSGIDIFILIVFVVAVIYGYYKGIIVQMGALGGIIVGILACRLFGDWLAGVFARVSGGSGNIDISYINSVLANVILFVLGFISAKLVARLVKTVTHAAKLGIIDRLCGMVFCLFEWFLVLSILFNLWTIIHPNPSLVSMSHLGDGRAVRVILDLAPTVFGSATADAIFG